MENNPKNFKKFKKGPLLLSVAFLAFSSFAFIFLYGKISKNDEISGKDHLEWQTETIRREEIRSLNRSIKEIETERTLLETHFAESGNVVPFLDTLEILAADAGVGADVISVDVEEDISELIVSLQTQGTFESTYKFIKLLENSPYELEIVSFEIDKGETGWQGSYTLRLLSFVK